MLHQKAQIAQTIATEIPNKISIDHITQPNYIDRIPDYWVEQLSYMIRTYDDFNRMLVQMKNRMASITPPPLTEEQIALQEELLGGATAEIADVAVSTKTKKTKAKAKSKPKNKPDYNSVEIENLEKIKSALSRRISKELAHWPIWEEWLAHVPGIGPSIGANLIMLYYYRHQAICQVCGAFIEKKARPDEPEKKMFWCPACNKAIKGLGNIVYALQRRTFPNVSKWWAFMGRKVVDGKIVKRIKKTQQTWSTKGKQTGFQIGDQFNRQGIKTPYGRFLLERKQKRKITHPDISDGHRLNMAKNEAVKLFLSHFWHVARKLEGLSTDGPYAEVILGHTGIIKPYYWKGGEGCGDDGCGCECGCDDE